MLSALPPISQFIETISTDIKHFELFRLNPIQSISSTKKSSTMSRKQQKYCLVKACKNHFGTTENVKMFQ